MLFRSYPDNVWYSFVKARDAEEIVREHLLNNRPVERLRRDNPANLAHADRRAEKRD